MKSVHKYFLVLKRATFLQKHASITIQFSHYTILYQNLNWFQLWPTQQLCTVTAWSTSIHMRLLEIHPPIRATHPTANM
jgi:hypothetical protein